MRPLPSEKPNNINPTSMRDVLDNLFGEPMLSPMSTVWGNWLRQNGSSNLPAIDISETDKEMRIEADIPGYDPEKIDVEIDGRMLMISGKHEEEREEKDKDKRYHRRERNYGEFSRGFRLPDDVDMDQIECSISNGTLTIKVPKTDEENNRRRLEVKKD